MAHQQGGAFGLAAEPPGAHENPPHQPGAGGLIARRSDCATPSASASIPSFPHLLIVIALKTRPAFSALVLAFAVPAQGAVIFWEELPYFSAADSPFYEGIQAGTIYLEDFEDHELNTPYVVSWDWPNSNQRGRTMRAAGNSFAWSVDGDDGLNGDFMGRNGDAWTTTSASNGGILGSMEFRFVPDILGRYPTFVGFVITAASDPFDDVAFGTQTLTGPESSDNEYDPLTWIPQISFPGDTRTHRFFGIYAESGISRLNIQNVAQIDHLQYGYAIPEPGPGGVAALAGMFWLVRRRRT
jgi:hypothetical protein